jgi:hypothetical protein
VGVLSIGGAMALTLGALLLLGPGREQLAEPQAQRKDDPPQQLLAKEPPPPEPTPQQVLNAPPVQTAQAVEPESQSPLAEPRKLPEPTL